MKSFQVNTGGIEIIKRALYKAWVDAGNRSTNGIEGQLDWENYHWLQFFYKGELRSFFGTDVYYSEDKYDGDPVPVVSLLEAFQRLVKPTSLSLELTKGYTAKYKKGDKKIAVGCSAFEVETLRELLKKVDELNGKS